MVEMLKSKLDQSVNFVDKRPEGAFESRYVYRPDTDYVICYLSSHTGCNKSCRFCHLTALGQTMMEPATLRDYRNQAERVLDHFLFDTDVFVRKLHYNFMARGEPFANPQILHRWEELRHELDIEAWKVGFLPSDISYKISTIMPKEIEGVDLFAQIGDTFDPYYSLYSFNPEFRKRWLPKAMDPNEALKQLAKWQDDSGKEVVIHGSFIADQNDSERDIEELIAGIRRSGVLPRFNLVRYNPPNDKSKESEHIASIAGILEREFAGSRVVPRVGYDVAASCGMFVC